MIYSPEHLALIKTVELFCADQINPNVVQWENDRAFPAHEVYQKLAALGLLGINKPERYGGLGLDYTFQLAFAEALGGSRLASLSLSVGVQTDMATPALARYGSPELCDEFLAPSISGKYVACLGVSEIGAGSDFANIATVAKRDGSDYIINGGKMWTTNGVQADWICLLAVTGGSHGALNKSLICVPKATRGVRVVSKLEKLGMHSSDTAQLIMEDVRVPQWYRIGAEGRGLIYQMHSFVEERLWAAASGLRCMERIIDETIEYARSRSVYGKSVLSNQVVQYTLAELKTEIELLRSLVYRAVQHYVVGEDITAWSAMVKLTAGRLQRKVVDRCLQFWGGMGYMDEIEVSRYYRDMRLTSIGGGADEVMLMMICRLMGILDRS